MPARRSIAVALFFALGVVACARPAPVPAPAPEPPGLQAPPATMVTPDPPAPPAEPAAQPPPEPAPAPPEPAPKPAPTVWRSGIWLERKWIEEVSPESAGRLVKDLAAKGITDLYIRTGPYRADGTLPLPSKERVSAMHAFTEQHGLRLWAWLPGWRPTLDLSQEWVIKSAAAAAATLSDTGFDGVQIDIEPTRDGDQGYLDLLDAVHRQFPKGKLVGAAAHLIRPSPPQAEWSADYYARVARKVDQIAVMAYDTYAADAEEFRSFVAYQTRTALARAPKSTEVLIGVPTYEDRTAKRTPETEPMDSGLRGVAEGLAKADLAGRTVGWALYAHFTTDEAEWRLFLNRPR